LPGGAIGLALGIALGVFHIRRFSSGDLAGKLLRTLGHMAYGRLVASIAGIALSAMIGSSRTMRSYLAPSLEFLRPLPVSAIIPVAIALLGLTQSMALRDLADAARDHPRLRSGRAAALRGRAVAAHVATGSDLQDRAAFGKPGHSFRHATEPDGRADPVGGLRNPRRPRRLGHWVLLSARAFRSADLFAGVIPLGGIGYLTALAMSAVEKRLLRWRSSGH
jgi:sulfonate transport system permease protein